MGFDKDRAAEYRNAHILMFVRIYNEYYLFKDSWDSGKGEAGVKPVLHINMADEGGKVYCCLRNRVVLLNEAQKSQYCGGCGMFAGYVGDTGVKCQWADVRLVSDPHVVADPAAEFASNQIKPVPADYLSTYSALEP